MHRFLHILLLLGLLPAATQAQDFTEFLHRVNTAQEQRRQFLVDSFLTVVPGFPYIESDTRVHFLYTGEAKDVVLAGDANNWNVTASPLTRLSTTSLWYRSEQYEADARLDYKLVVDKNWMLDPRNPLTITSGYGPNSELRMPDYLPPQEIQPQQHIAGGSLVDTQFTSAALQNTREARIYLPAGYAQSEERYPVVLFHDGPDYLSLARTATILDNLIHERRIPPCIAVFLPPVDRSEEYAGSRRDAFAAFVVDEVMAAVDRSYRTRRDPSARAVIGASNGGNIALYTAMRYPQCFGNAGGQSSNIIAEISDTFRDGPFLPLRLYLDLGTYDIPVLLPLVRNFIPILADRGYDHLYREHHEGHSWGNWRAHIDDALEFFFADLVGAAPLPERSRGTLIRGVTPHPLHSAGQVHVQLRRPSSLQFRLWDMAGRLQRTQRSGMLSEGAHAIPLDVSGLPTGHYLLDLATTQHRETRVILLR
ncbi:MAG: alpha/beta hydrolase-fold protein [Bacteroidota bacterium]|nr:alpha/beta hydrolase-fold protein [Bacteroidota bacterium]